MRIPDRVTLDELARRFPVHCFASGPTNSMRGAAFLSGAQDAIVVEEMAARKLYRCTVCQR